jgi:hypothetical protein
MCVRDVLADPDAQQVAEGPNEIADVKVTLDVRVQLQVHLLAGTRG